MKRAGAVAAAILVSSLLSVAAQVQTPADRPTFRTGVDVLPLDVTVLGSDRRPVRGLTARDFRVLVDGEERPIVAFEPVELPDRATAGARWLQDVDPDVSTNGFVPDRIIVLLLDDWNTAPQPWGAAAVRRIGLAVLDELHPTDLVGVVYPFLSNRGVEFTTDRARLRAAVERFTVVNPGGTGTTGACPHNSCVLDAMRGIAAATRAWPDRRKLVVYISPEGNYKLGPQNIEQNNFEGNIAGVDMAPALMDTFRELQRANVTVYQFDPRGLEETAGISASSPGMGMFADNTGGWTATRSNAPWMRAQQMFVENDSYYMLGITPSASLSRSGFHPIRVTVNRPDVVVRSRTGYYDPSPERKGSAPQSLTALDRAMTGPVPLADLPLSLTAAAFRVPGTRQAAVAVTAGIDRAADRSEVETVEVAVRAFDERSARRESRGVWTSTMKLQPQVSSLGVVHYDTVMRLDLPPGSYEIRLSMRRGSDNVAGGVTRSVVVPDFEKEQLTVSGVVLHRVRDAVPARGAPMASVLPFAPTTRRTFARAESVAALLRVYQGGKDPLRPVPVTARIVSETDLTVFEETVELTPVVFLGPARSAEFQFDLPLATLRSGEYLLTIDATLDRRTVRAAPVRFRVRGG